MPSTDFNSCPFQIFRTLLSIHSFRRAPTLRSVTVPIPRREFMTPMAWCPSYGAANHHIVPSDYRVNLGIEQPLFPVATEVAAVDKARAELRKAQAGYDQARLDAETKLRGALSARHEAEASFAAAKASLSESQQVLTLTESLYHAGRTDLDSVQHAQMDRDKAAAGTRSFASKRASAVWGIARALQPSQFPDVLFEQLHLQVEARRWRDGDDKDEPPAHVGD
jgi:Outer membrane efflux protein